MSVLPVMGGCLMGQDPLAVEHSEELGNETLQSSTPGLAATLTSASVWKTKGEEGYPEEIGGLFPLL